MTVKINFTKIPNAPGVYFFYNAQKELIYIGKATSLKNRVASYFQGMKSPRPIEEFIAEVDKIKWQVTDSVLEAIILEANLIKKHQPKHNVLGKDDKSWNYLVITKEKFPKLLAIRQHDLKQQDIKKYLKMFGPYPCLNTQATLKLLRQLFSYSTCKENQDKPCFYYQIHQCLGVCTGEITPQEYKQKVITPLISLLSGKKKQLLTKLNKKMKSASKEQDFEEAARLRNQIYNLQKIYDVALLSKTFYAPTNIRSSSLRFARDDGGGVRVEGYDISNLGSTNKVGSLVVFNQQGPLKNEYKKFKIKTIPGQNDVDCLGEVIERRLKHAEWPLPDILLIDGGKPQVNKVKSILQENKIGLPVIGIAKGPERKKNEFIIHANEKSTREWIATNKNLFIQVRDEAHRFAINYQKKLRSII